MHALRRIPKILIATATLFCAMAGGAAAYPDQPISLVVPFPAGGGVDLVGRLYAQRIGEAAGANIVVENRAGAGGTIGVGALARSAADGHHLVLGSPGNISIAPSVYPSLNYAPERDLQPIGMAAQVPILLVARPDAPFDTVAGLIAYGKSNPGKLAYASGGAGTSLHLSGAMLAEMAGIDALHVPYKGSTPAVADLMGGRVDYMFVDTSVMPSVRAGKLKLLGVTSARRSPLLPDVPTISESGLPGYEVINWYGFFAPADTPADRVEWLAGQVRAALADPAFVEKLHAQMLDVPGMDRQAFGKFVADDIAKWAGLIRAAGIKLQ